MFSKNIREMRGGRNKQFQHNFPVGLPNNQLKQSDFYLIKTVGYIGVVYLQQCRINTTLIFEIYFSLCLYLYSNKLDNLIKLC